jgi:hypothetical protein
VYDDGDEKISKPSLATRWKSQKHDLGGEKFPTKEPNIIIVLRSFGSLTPKFRFISVSLQTNKQTNKQS